MNDKEQTSAIIACFLCTFVGIIFGGFFGAVCSMHDTNAIYKQAADQGAGEWVADPRTGKTAWVWTGR